MYAIKYFGEFAHLNFQDTIDRLDEFEILVNSLTKKRTKKTSKYVGISLNRRDKVWTAKIGKKIIGNYKTEEDAYNAYCDYKENLDNEVG